MSVRIPMKFTEVELSSVDQYIADDEFVFEQKFDGTRGLAVITTAGVWFPGSGGRSSLAHTAATQHLPRINPALARLVTDEVEEIVVDGEIMCGTGEFMVWDIAYLRLSGVETVTPSSTFATRRRALEMLAALLPADGPVHVVRQARGPAEKRALWDAVRDGGGEGIMAKRLDSPYNPGARVKHTLKLKFVKTAEVVVMGVDRPDAKHGSFALGAYNEAGELVRVGACSAIGKDTATKVGDVIEVAFLYWTGSSVYQPRMLKIRDDKEPSECLVSLFPTYSREAR